MDNNSNESQNPNRVPATTSSSPSSSSPFVQESPFYAFMKNLSPIKSDKIARYTQRFWTSNIPIPQQPVFASPQMDLQRRNGLLKREENDALCFGTHGEVGTQRKKEPISIVQDDVQLCSPSVFVDNCFADPLQIEDTMDAFNLHARLEDGKEKILDSGVAGTEQTSMKTSDCRRFSGGPATQDAGCKYGKAEASAASHSFPLLLSGNEKSGGFAEDSRPFSKGFIKENEHHQCGIRRYLHCETTTTNKSTCNGTDDMNNVSLPARLQASGSTSSFESLVSHNDHPIGFTSSQQDCPSSQNVICGSFSFHYDHFRFPPSQTYGKSRQLGTELSVARQSANNVTRQWEKIMPRFSFSTPNDTCSVSIPLAVGELYTFLQDGPHERRETSITGSIVPLANNVQCPNIQHLTPFDLQTPLCENLPSSGDTNIVEELNQKSPQRSRKRTKQEHEIDGCKRCNCKRSKCLKLYCECFAAGLYCLDSCPCENCFNKLEYEDTVLDTRKQIELRNPLAFAPKVVKHTASSPANTMEEVKQTTPSSARHKRGCNCKKSKCVKKYCECYQANVGCSDGCRCGGCDNPFGRKAEFLYRRIKKWENQSQQKSCNGTGRPPRLSPTWEALADITNLKPPPLPSLGAVASGAGNKLLQANGCYSLVGNRHMQCTPTEFTPESGGSLREFASANPFPYLLNDDPTLQIPDNMSTTQTAAKFGSLNQKRGLRQNLSHGLLSGRKFSLRAVPSFPPLSPYRSKSPDGTTNTGLAFADENACED